MRALDPGGQEPQFNVANNLSRFWRWAKNVAGTITVQKRTEITIETDQIVVVRKRQLPVRSWCRECGREVEMVDVKEAEALTGAPQAMLSSAGEHRGWHWSQAEDGSPLVCLDSVLRSKSRGT
jgi:hypothetical protein